MCALRTHINRTSVKIVTHTRRLDLLDKTTHCASVSILHFGIFFFLFFFAGRRVPSRDYALLMRHTTTFFFFFTKLSLKLRLPTLFTYFNIFNFQQNKRYPKQTMIRDKTISLDTRFLTFFNFFLIQLNQGKCYFYLPFFLHTDYGVIILEEK